MGGRAGRPLRQTDGYVDATDRTRGRTDGTECPKKIQMDILNELRRCVPGGWADLKSDSTERQLRKRIDQISKLCYQATTVFEIIPITCGTHVVLDNHLQFFSLSLAIETYM